MYQAKSKARIKLANYLFVGFTIVFLYAIFQAKSAQKRGESYSYAVIDKSVQIKSDFREEQKKKNEEK